MFLNFIYDYLGFLLKAITIAIVLLIIILSLKGDKELKKKRGRIVFEDVSADYEELHDNYDEIFSEKESGSEKNKLGQKKWWQFWKKSKQTSDEKENSHKLFVIHYDGDIAASATQQLKQEVNVVVNVAKENDQVVVCLKSPGGVVNGYGLAAAQLERIKDHNLSLTVAVDEVAASGGYLMACVANRIIAAPFAIIGSIGVVAQLPNFHKLLEKYDIDFEQFTAGKYKRTVTMFGENTDEGREKFKEELEDIHEIFKTFVSKHRPSLDIETIATGEHWLGVKAKALGLIDELGTSDEYIQSQLKNFQVVGVQYVEKKSLRASALKMFAKLHSKFNF